MNYKSQLKGWAVDRVIELAKANATKPTLADVMDEATRLAKYAYVGEEDFKDACQRVVECLKEMCLADALERIIQLQNELAYVQEDIERQSNLAKVVNTNQSKQETVQ